MSLGNDATGQRYPPFLRERVGRALSRSMCIVAGSFHRDRAILLHRVWRDAPRFGASDTGF